VGEPPKSEKPSDPRDKEQIMRQYAEAKRRKDNLTEKDHIDKPKNNLFRSIGYTNLTSLKDNFMKSVYKKPQHQLVNRLTTNCEPFY